MTRTTVQRSAVNAKITTPTSLLPQPLDQSFSLTPSPTWTWQLQRSKRRIESRRQFPKRPSSRRRLLSLSSTGIVAATTLVFFWMVNTTTTTTTTTTTQAFVPTWCQAGDHSHRQTASTVTAENTAFVGRNHETYQRILLQRHFSSRLAHSSSLIEEPVLSSADYQAELEAIITSLRQRLQTTSTRNPSSNEAASLASTSTVLSQSSMSEVVQSAMDVFDRMLQAYLDNEQDDDIDNDDSTMDWNDDTIVVMDETEDNGRTTLEAVDSMSISTLLPSVTIYNQLLRIHWLALQLYSRQQDSRHDDLVQAAWHMVQRMSDDTNTLAARPNMETYQLVINILLASGQREWYARIMPLYDEVMMSSMNMSDTDAIAVKNYVIQALALQGTSSNDLDRAMSMLQRLLQKMDQDDDTTGTSAATANSKNMVHWTTWMRLLQAHAQRGDVAMVDTLISQMQASLGSNGDVYHMDATAIQNARLQALVQSDSFVKSTASSPNQPISKQAEAILYSMIASTTTPKASTATTSSVESTIAYWDNVDKDNWEARYEMAMTGPDNDSFYHVIQSYRRNKDTAGCAFKVEQLLSQQEALLVAAAAPSSTRIAANAKTWTAAIAVMARDRTDVKKATKAKRILDRIMESLPDGKQPSLNAIQGVLNACAFTPKTASAADKMAAFTIAVECLNLALDVQKESEVKASQTKRRKSFCPSCIYGQFLSACHTLLPSSNKKRDAIVEAAFDKCCQAGYVNAYVLEQLERAASDELVLKLLGGFFEDGVEPPAAWSINVDDGSRHT